jgi:hypothetical protein
MNAHGSPIRIRVPIDRAQRGIGWIYDYSLVQGGCVFALPEKRSSPPPLLFPRLFEYISLMPYEFSFSLVSHDIFDSP